MCPTIIPQHGPVVSISPPQNPLIQGGNFYPRGNNSFVTQPSISYGPPLYMTSSPPLGNYYPLQPVYPTRNQLMERPSNPSGHLSLPWSNSRAHTPLNFLATIEHSPT